MWLRERDSLELEEIRSVFRALLAKHIELLWFTGRIFNASVRESFGLVLRNQRDRFLLSYYEHISVDCPQDEKTNRFIWSYAFGLDTTITNSCIQSCGEQISTHSCVPQGRR